MSVAPTLGIDVGGTKVESALVDATAEYLRLGLVGIVNAFNPHRIVLGGGVIEGGARSAYSRLVPGVAFPTKTK